MLPPSSPPNSDRLIREKEDRAQDAETIANGKRLPDQDSREQPTRASRVMRLSVELLVTALGVFLGVGLDGWQEARQEAEQQARHRTQVYRVLDQRLTDVRQHLNAALPAFERERVQPFFDAYRAGDMPRPTPLYYYAPGVGASAWEALVKTDLDALDLSVIIAAQDFRDAERDMEVVTRDVRRLSDRYLVPTAGSSRSEFYDEETTQLRPKYLWYPRALAQMRQSVTLLQARADTLQAVLDRVRKRPPGEGNSE